MMTNTRLRLGDPRSQRPGDMQLLNAICTELRTVKRHQRNTSNVWDFNDLIINVQPNIATYQINQADFGTPLAVVSWNPTNPMWVARLIPIFQPQNMAFDYSLPNNIGNYYWPADGSNCTALRCAFYWRNGQAFIEFLPLPTLGCQYRVRYLMSANGINEAALSESPVSNEDADIVETRAALALLSTTEWQMPDTPSNRQ